MQPGSYLAKAAYCARLRLIDWLGTEYFIGNSWPVQGSTLLTTSNHSLAGVMATTVTMPDKLVRQPLMCSGVHSKSIQCLNAQILALAGFHAFKQSSKAQHS